MAPEFPQSEPVDYVVVVHGMGRQRRHASLVKVIHRFAEACQEEGSSLAEGMVTLASTRPGRPWIEFEGIPARGSSSSPFTAQESSTGNNLRFSDLYWSPLTDEAVRQMADPADEWVRAIAARVAQHQEALRRRAALLVKARTDSGEGSVEAAPRRRWRPRLPWPRGRRAPVAPAAAAGEASPPASVPFWLSHLIRLCRTLIRVVRPLLAVARPALAREIFDEYLGDVQVYCESRELRSRAIGRFHGFIEALVRIHRTLPADQGGNRPPRITVLAHSLGSVLALDALLLAHLRDGRSVLDADAWKKGRADTIEEIFASWGRGKPKSIPEKDVTATVHALVTIGCPMEKVIALWPHNHQFHAIERNHREARELRGLSPLIRHVNLLDAMDVVADPLVTLRSSLLYQAVFSGGSAAATALGEGSPAPAAASLERDYCFEPTPFVAHAAYASDPRIFRWIRGMVWGSEAGAAESFPWGGGGRGLDRLVHAQLPVMGGLTAALAAAAVLMAQSIGTAAIASCVLFGMLFVGGTALRVVGWWSCVIGQRRDATPTRLRFRARPWWSALLRAAAMLGSCVSAILMGFLWERPWVEFLLPMAAFGLGVAWRLARHHEERAGSRRGRGPPYESPRTRRATALIASLASFWVLAALLVLRWGAPPDIRSEMGGTFELVVIAGIGGLATTWFGRASALPPSVQALRGPNTGAFLRNWGLSAYLWGALYMAGCTGLYVVLRDETAIDTFGRMGLVRAVARLVPSAVVRHPNPFLCLVYLCSTGVWAALLVVRGEQELANDRMDWSRMWKRKSMADYVRPDAEGAAPPAAPPPREDPRPA